MVKHDRILITGGAGFVGSSLGLRLKERNPKRSILALDNLRRKGSKLNIPRLKRAGIQFKRGDIRNPKDLRGLGRIDLILECSAEPSVLAGYGPEADYTVQTNLVGTLHCLDLARRNKSDIIFLSTSRVFPYEALDRIAYKKNKSRFVFKKTANMAGFSPQGISESFTLEGVRSLYGATKLASEHLIHEYGSIYGFRSIVNRCGVIAGPWQMGKVDQGIVAFWVAAHYFQKPLAYIGYGGQGFQVRDLLHIDDLYNLIEIQMRRFKSLSGSTYNVGGGAKHSLSLKELTALSQRYTGNRVPIRSVRKGRPGDVRVYITDNRKISRATGWRPQIGVKALVKDVVQWIDSQPQTLKKVLAN